MTFPFNLHIRGLSALLTLCILALTAGSCASEGPEPEPETGPKCVMGLYVALNDISADRAAAMAPTRAGEENVEEIPTIPGAGFENQIDRQDLRVYLFGADGLLISDLIADQTKTEFGIRPVYPTVDSDLYQIWFRLDSIIPGAATSKQTFRVVMLANWGTYPAVEKGKTRITDLTSDGSAIGQYDPTVALDRMPFFGVQEYRDVLFISGNLMHILPTPLSLLRAFAKVEIYDADASSKYRMNGVTLHRYNDRLYKGPLGVDHNDGYVDGDGVENPVPALSFKAEWEKPEGTVSFARRESDGHFIAYVPEYMNLGRTAQAEGDDDGRAYLTVTYPEDPEMTYRIDFQYYGNPPAGSALNDPYDLHRNHWYKISVNRTDKDMDVKTNILPYQPVVLEPEFGIRPPETPTPAE